MNWMYKRKSFHALFVFMCFRASWCWPGTRSNLPKYYKKRCWCPRIGNTLGPMRWPLLRLPLRVYHHEKEHWATTFMLGAHSAPRSIWGSAFQASVALGSLKLQVLFICSVCFFRKETDGESGTWWGKWWSPSYYIHVIEHHVVIKHSNWHFHSNGYLLGSLPLRAGSCLKCFPWVSSFNSVMTPVDKY